LKLKLSALRGAIDFPYTLDDLVRRLGDVGIEVESTFTSMVGFQDVVVARVATSTPHPTHHRLQVIELDLGPHGSTTVCTAATNVNAGDIVPVVLPGGSTADGAAIEPRTFGAIESRGMLCSWKELGLDADLLTSEEKEGILHLEPGAVPGMLFEEAWPVADTTLDISVTPDRGDALSVLGIARWIEVLKAHDENRAFDTSDIKLPLPSALPRAKNDGDLVVDIDDHALCSSYIGMLVRDVSSGRSSYEFRTQLYQLCIRPVSRVVDMTNLCLKQYGQPTHAFDYDTIEEHHITVRASREHETIVTLDGVLRRLEPGTLIIADARRPIAVAGVMGGLDSSVTAQTTNVVFEIAHFDARAVARASRHLGLKTDAAYLFERGTDPSSTLMAVPSVLSALVREQCVGCYVSRVASAGLPAPARTPVALDLQRVNGYLGTDLGAAEIQKLLAHEGIRSVQKQSGLVATPPSFRGDLTTWPEFVEEIVRMEGYDQFPSHVPSQVLRRGRQSALKLLTKRIRASLTGLGLTESRTISFVRQSTIASLGLPPAPALLNPLSGDWDALRPTLAVGLAAAASHNLSRGKSGFASFELGKTFSLSGGTFGEDTSLGVLLAGRWQESNWTTPPLDADVFVLKGLVESLLDDLHVPYTLTPSGSALFDAGGGVLITSGDVPLGSLGILGQRARSTLEVEQTMFYAELSVEALLARIPALSFREYSRFPGVRRDISVLVDQQVPAGQLQDIISDNAGPLLKSVTIFDCFQGGSLPPGKKSVGFSLEFVSPDRTLTSDEVDRLVGSVESALATRAGGTLRRTRM